MIDKADVNKIFFWKEALKKYKDSDFLDVIRTYLGKINTPYNKDDLLNQLVVCLKKEDNLSRIKMMIDATDAKILSIIELLGSPSVTEIGRFISNELSLYEFTNRIINLQDRLLIFKILNDHSVTYRINPVLRNELVDIININNIISVIYAENQPGVWLKANILSGVLSFVNFQTDVCKKDGTLKKKSVAVAEKIFHSSFEHKNLQAFSVSECVERLILAMINLNLFSLTEFDLSPNVDAWNSFAKLSTAQQAVFLCAARCTMENKKACNSFANAIFAFCDIYKNRRINVSDFKIAFDVAVAAVKEDASQSQKNRISGILGKANSAPVIDIIDVELILLEMSFFGLINFSADKKQIDVLPFANEVLHSELKSVNIESNLEISIFEGDSLERLIPLMMILSVLSVDKLSYFKISKDTYLKAFDFGFFPEKIFNLLTENSNHPIPDSLRFFINDGFEEYKSCALYKGYIIQADKTKSIIIENSKAFCSIMKLADGIFLIPENFYSENDREILKLCKQAGLESVRALRNDIERKELFNFEMQIPKEKRLNILSESPIFNDDKITEYFKTLISELTAKKFPTETEVLLKERILQKLIISSSQLDEACMKYERILADGMDFAGKARIIDAARNQGEKIEIRIIGAQNSSVGIPVEIHRKANDVLVAIEFSDTKRREVFNIARISYVRRISPKIFSNFDLL